MQARRSGTYKLEDAGSGKIWKSSGSGLITEVLDIATDNVVKSIFLYFSFDINT